MENDLQELRDLIKSLLNIINFKQSNFNITLPNDLNEMGSVDLAKLYSNLKIISLI